MRITGNQPVARGKLALAKRFRREMTREERLLWNALKTNALGGLHFRRQQVIAGFIVDFYCASARLAIEIDGGVHLGRKGYDFERDRALSELGIRTLRLSNESIASDFANVLCKINEEISSQASASSDAADRNIFPSVPPSLRENGARGAGQADSARVEFVEESPFDAFHEECGVFGVYRHPEAANLAYLGLYALQHRGQESAGIVSSNGKSLIAHRGMGLVADIFNSAILARLEGTSAIGHNRYSTTGSTTITNCQPLSVEYARGGLAIAHNGNLVNFQELRERLEANGSIFQSSSDSEVIIHLIAGAHAPTLPARVAEALAQVRGAYSLLVLTENAMIAVRDPHGFRPLVLGNLNGATIVASETCALDLVRAEYVREVEPGEMIVIDEDGMRSLHPFGPAAPRRCIFEYVYFSRPDSLLYGRNVYSVRKQHGRALARECPADADLVVPVPDSGTPAALGYAQESGLPLEMALVRSHYVGRTFIEPRQSIRHFGVKIKFNPVSDLLRGKRIVLIEDSLVRGTTLRKVIPMLRQAGAREVHMRIAAPPTTHSCFYGIDTPTREELLASSHSIEEIRRYITADSLGYLSWDGLYAFLGNGGREGFCDACFTGKYPVEIPRDAGPSQLHLFLANENGVKDSGR
ncbi:MAG TPA: amidophosphoribosyltransferase [Candidatus Binataceae bacterium]|nr:amidophosphoribosyltransferase [Candidatus Binataceae bacterium]